MYDDVKDLIKIPVGLDNAVLKGFEDGKKKSKYNKRINIIKKSSIAAGIVIVSTISIGIVNPKIVSAIPVVNRVFDYFNNSNFGHSIKKYEELGEVINKSIDKNGTKITLDQIVVDDNVFMATLKIESDVLKGFEDKKNEGDFFTTDYSLKINGQEATSYGQTVTIINETKGAVILKANISDIKLNYDLKIDLGIRNIERSGKVIAKGSWDYNIKTTKGIKVESYTSNKNIKVDGGEIWVDRLVKTPITNRLIIKGNMKLEQMKLMN